MQLIVYYSPVVEKHYKCKDYGIPDAIEDEWGCRLETEDLSEDEWDNTDFFSQPGIVGGKVFTDRIRIFINC